MRPIKRPSFDKTYRSYGSYLTPLINSFGPYCSYCEGAEKLDIEHVVPKSKQPTLTLEWTNLLLGCARCNRDFKKAWNDDRVNYLWPDINDTFHAFIYEKSGRVLVNDQLEEQVHQAAENLIDLVKLDDGKTTQPVLNTRRRDTFNFAYAMKRMFVKQALSLDDLMLAVYRAPSWSVWMTVFSDQPEVKERLLTDERFPGTAIELFR